MFLLDTPGLFIASITLIAVRRSSEVGNLQPIYQAVISHLEYLHLICLEPDPQKDTERKFKKLNVRIFMCPETRRNIQTPFVGIVHQDSLIGLSLVIATYRFNVSSSTSNQLGNMWIYQFRNICMQLILDKASDNRQLTIGSSNAPLYIADKDRSPCPPSR